MIGGDRRIARGLLAGLVDYWPLTEQSGSRSSLTGRNNLTDNNTVTGNPGKFGQASQFTAATLEYLSIADNADLSLGNVPGVTICVWAYFDATPADQIFICSKERDDDTAREFVVRTVSTTFYGSSHLVDAAATTFGALAANTWYWLCFQNDISSGIVRAGVNNVFDDYTGGTATQDSNGTFNVGRERNVARYMNGRLAGLGYWKRNLLQSELNFIYNNSIGRPLFSP